MTETNTANHDDRLKAVLAEYNDCREEIRIRIQQRTRMTEFYIVGVSAIVGLAIQSQNFFLMLVAPAYAIFIYAMLIGTYFYTDSLAHYIREEIELKKIPHILGNVPQMDFQGNTPILRWQTGWLGWETNYEKVLRERNPLRRKKVLYVFSWGLIIVSSLSLAQGLLLLEFNLCLATVISSVAFIVYGGLIEWMNRLRYSGKR